MKSGIPYIITGILLILVGVVAIPMLLIIPKVRDFPAALQFIVPGQIESTIPIPGKYYLWNDYRTRFEGQDYDRDPSLPKSMQITVTDPTGQPLEFIRRGTVTIEMDSKSSRSVGFVLAREAGTVRIRVTGLDQPRVFSFSQTAVIQRIASIFASGFLAFLVLMTGIGFTIYGLIDRKPAEEVSWNT